MRSAEESCFPLACSVSESAFECVMLSGLDGCRSICLCLLLCSAALLSLDLLLSFPIISAVLYEIGGVVCVDFGPGADLNLTHVLSSLTCVLAC